MLKSKEACCFIFCKTPCMVLNDDNSLFRSLITMEKTLRDHIVQPPHFLGKRTCSELVSSWHKAIYNETSLGNEALFFWREHLELGSESSGWAAGLAEVWAVPDFPGLLCPGSRSRELGCRPVMSQSPHLQGYSLLQPSIEDWMPLSSTWGTFFS